VIEALIALLFGLLIGSFLNVCIHRWPRNRSVVKPRSHCVRCRKPIAWYDNIPLVSYLLLGGRCRRCHAKISWRYPLVEFLTAVLFFYQVGRLGPTLPALKMCVFSALAVALMFCDLEKRILPDEFTLGGTALGLIFSAFVPMAEPNFFVLFYSLATRSELPNWLRSPAESAFSAILPTFFLWLAGWLYLKIRHREGLGLGDVKLVAMVGSFLGLFGALQTLLLGSIGGAVIGYSYIKLTGRDPASYELPFGTFLAAAALFASIVGLFPM
jgi:leader peptidase (prepilin peptidase) / N-methyltransferase